MGSTEIQNMTSIEFARKEGYRAQQDGVSRYQNPYTDNELYQAWLHGWLEAAWDE